MKTQAARAPFKVPLKKSTKQYPKIRIEQKTHAQGQ